MLTAMVLRLNDGSGSGSGSESWATASGALLSMALALLDLRVRAGLLPARAPLCVMWLMLGATLSLAGVSVWARGWAWQTSPLRFGVVAMGGASGHRHADLQPAAAD